MQILYVNLATDGLTALQLAWLQYRAIQVTDSYGGVLTLPAESTGTLF